jgi:hypothetical protein
MCYYGTGCFHRREALCGRIYSPDYKEDWTRVARKTEDVIDLEGMAESLVTCTYEHNTLWGVEVDLYTENSENAGTVIEVTLCYFKITEISHFMYGPYLTEFELLNYRRELYMVAHWRMSLQDCRSSAVGGDQFTTTRQERGF